MQKNSLLFQAGSNNDTQEDNSVVSTKLSEYLQEYRVACINGNSEEALRRLSRYFNPKPKRIDGIKYVYLNVIESRNYFDLI